VIGPTWLMPCSIEPSERTMEDQPERSFRVAYQDAAIEQSHAQTRLDSARTGGTQDEYAAAFRAASDAQQRSKAAFQATVSTALVATEHYPA
jgi:hypothetical protein